MSTAMTPTLPGSDYCSPTVYEVDCDRIFHRQWFYAGRAERLGHVGDRLLVDVGGESILVVRDADGELHAHYNVCRHRGSQLCDASGSGFGAAITCPYHAWSFSLDGRLVATPHVGKEELDRSCFSLRSVAVEDWHGFVFVNIGDDPPSVRDWIADQDPHALGFERLEMDRLRIGHRSSCEVAANWKILIENYDECLHCPKVHPELVDVIPLHRQGDVIDRTRNDGGTWLAEGADSFSLDGRSALPVIATMTEQDANSYQASCLYPNLFLDITGTSVIATQLIPKGPDLTQINAEYLFDADAVAADDFDPSAVVDFSELVLQQDNEVCERTQRGVSSRSFDHGYFAERDSLCVEFIERYLADRGPIEA
ncbi:MAG: aromatic ring-hydroxylating dioxygenase subunit alpha [Actinobacteria bacterium]|nr:aromatic ring-hydroxylating dioxygenase subunit alpha [Actinomycetota bacterium]